MARPALWGMILITVAEVLVMVLMLLKYRKVHRMLAAARPEGTQGTAVYSSLLMIMAMYPVLLVGTQVGGWVAWTRDWWGLWVLVFTPLILPMAFVCILHSTQDDYAVKKKAAAAGVAGPSVAPPPPPPPPPQRPMYEANRSAMLGGNSDFAGAPPPPPPVTTPPPPASVHTQPPATTQPGRAGGGGYPTFSPASVRTQVHTHTHASASYYGAPPPTVTPLHTHQPPPTMTPASAGPTPVVLEATYSLGIAGGGPAAGSYADGDAPGPAAYTPQRPAARARPSALRGGGGVASAPDTRYTATPPQTYGHAG